MKRTDIGLIILIASISVGVAYVVANSIFSGIITTESAKVQTIDPITSAIKEPSTTIFNDDSINPSVEVQVDNTSDKTAADTGSKS